MTEADLTVVAETDDDYGIVRRIFRRFVHWASYKFVLSSRRTRQVAIDDLQLEIPPTVFHPGVFVTSKIFARYLRTRDFTGKSAVEVGTGSGILALSAARAGADRVLALDINPNAVQGALANAQRNGLRAVVDARQSDLFSSVARSEQFDVVISSPPSFAGEAIDLADRAWHAGPGYCHIRPLFLQAAKHLKPDGEMLILLSSDTNIALMERLAGEAGLTWTLVVQRSILVEAFLIYRLHHRSRAMRRTPVSHGKPSVGVEAFD